MTPRRSTLAAILATGILATACTKSENWEEEVKLSTGEVVVVTRTQTYERYSELGAPGDGWLRVEARLKFTPPIAGSAPVTWQADLHPLILDLANGNPVIVAKADYCEQYYRHGHPIPPYMVFEFLDGQWKRSKLSATHANAKANLLLNVEDRGDRSRVTIDFKSRSNSRPGLPINIRQIDFSYRMVC